jgi:hypothetical protein
VIPLGLGGSEGAGKPNWKPPFQLSGFPDVFSRDHRHGNRKSRGRLGPGESERLAVLLSEKGVNLSGIHGTEQHRLRLLPPRRTVSERFGAGLPAADPFQNRPRIKDAGFTLALLPLEGPEGFHQVAAGPGFSSFLQAGSFDTSILCPRTRRVSFLPSERLSRSRTGFGMAI